MKLKMIGMNHKTAKIIDREKFALNGEKINEAFEKIRVVNGIKEAVILSTCNRIEIYCAAEEQKVNIKQKIKEIIGAEEVPEENFYEYEGEKCIEHLFKVSSSLDSLVIGEGQILSQVKEAYARAKKTTMTGTILNTVFNRAIATGKQVRTETKIAYNSVSVSYAAVELAEKKLNGLKNKKALIFGAGKMAQLTTQHLKARGIEKIFVANRHIEKAQELAEKINGEAVEWALAMEKAENADVIVTSTGAPHYVVKKEQIEKLMEKRKGRELFIIDIAVPRDTEPEVGKIEGVILYNIDDLEMVVEEHVRIREEEAKLAEKIIEENVSNLMERFKYLKFQPIMAKVSDRAEEVRARELKKAAAKLKLSEPEKKVMENMTRVIVRKLLREPMKNLTRSAGTMEEKFYTEAMKALFKE